MAQIKQPNLPPNILDNFYVVLCNTSHPGNIGSAARAMKTMGLTNLILVTPNIMQTPLTPFPPKFDIKHPEHFVLPEECFALAAGAKDVLSKAQIVSHLSEALKPMHLCYALTARNREITATLQTPKEIIPELIQAGSHQQKIALVFGSETYGLSIAEVSLCNRLITIEANPEYSSLNLAQAVQVITYELYSSIDKFKDELKEPLPLATREETLGLMSHWEQTMQCLGYFDKRNKDRLLRRMQRFIDKSQIEKDEIDILRGFFNSVQKKIVTKNEDSTALD